ncbi:hypothetical protein ACWOVX_004331 [Vibrio vulnificus]|nr:hypothetical protein [Vibrio vulnificus]EHU4850537.1 hypothetical protein [Vibrio vulnificus]EID0694479.1 hypothetical protein [Vibrio vulnificus]EIV8483774.1 hypothetical protein [Vibrio vulnificus]EIX4885403.1 hypothetical protein [Vibrio vulnificus]
MTELFESFPFGIAISSFVLGFCVAKYRENRHRRFKRNKFYEWLPTCVYRALPENCSNMTREQLITHYIKNAPGIPIGIIASQLNQFEWLKGEKFDGEVIISHDDRMGAYTDTEINWVNKQK